MSDRNVLLNEEFGEDQSLRTSVENLKFNIISSRKVEKMNSSVQITGQNTKIPDRNTIK